MKIIFLDIDGVLNVYCQSRDEFGCVFHKHFENNLAHIIDETGAKIVISSSWRLSGLKATQEMWLSRKLPGQVIDVTPNLTYGPNAKKVGRGSEIKQWLTLNPNITSFCIIDDDTDMLPEQMPFFVKTSGNISHDDCIDLGYGLTKICAQQAITILGIVK